MKKYYALETNGNEADIYIFGDIVDPTTQEFWGMPADVSGYSLVQEIKDLDVDVINVRINSYGGMVSEGLAIYNALRDHKAKIRTIVDGFACSAASVVFMAGDERIMHPASLLMIHNAWVTTWGDANQLRKDADDLEKITQATKSAYLEHINVSEEELTKMMDKETWILPDEALEMGFATAIMSEPTTAKAAASARKVLFNLVRTAARQDGPVVITLDSGVSIKRMDEAFEKFEKAIQNLGIIVEGRAKSEPVPDPALDHDPNPVPDPDPGPINENKTTKFLSALLMKR